MSNLAAASTGRARAAEQTSQKSADDARQLATAFLGISSMAENLNSWLASETANGDGPGSTPKGLSGQQVATLLQRVSVFHTYAAAHAKTSDEMAKRAEARAQDAMLAVTEAEADEKKAAEQQATMAAATGSAGRKRSASTVGGKTKAKKPALADQVAAARAAHAENAAKQTKAKPTKLEKDIAKEIKLLQTTKGVDKSQDYTVRRCVQRIEALVEKDEANAVEALVAQGGIEVIMEANGRANRSASSSNDLRCLAEAACGIFQVIAQVNLNHLLEDARFALLWSDFSKLKEDSTWFDLMVGLATNDPVCEKLHEPDYISLFLNDFKERREDSVFFGAIADGLKQNNSFSKAFLENASPEDLAAFFTGNDRFHHAKPMDEPEFDYIYSYEHEKLNKFLLLVAKTELGLSKLRAGDGRALKKFVTSHDKEYKEEGRWGNRSWVHETGENCTDCCHETAKKIMELLE